MRLGSKVASIHATGGRDSRPPPASENVARAIRNPQIGPPRAVVRQQEGGRAAMALLTMACRFPGPSRISLAVTHKGLHSFLPLPGLLPATADDVIVPGHDLGRVDVGKPRVHGPLSEPVVPRLMMVSKLGPPGGVLSAAGVRGPAAHADAAKRERGHVASTPPMKPRAIKRSQPSSTVDNIQNARQFLFVEAFATIGYSSIIESR